MSSFERVQTLQQRVKSLLLKEGKYRDSDDMLIARIWSNHLEASNFNPKTMTAYEFLCQLAIGELPSADAITRARRKVQEENPSLRGRKWAERQNEAKDFKQQINS